MLRKATQRLIPGLVEAASVSAPSRFATPCPAAMVTQRHVTARRAFSATTRTLQEEKKDEKPAEKAAGDAKAEGGSAAEEELRKQLVAKDKRIAELQDHYLRALADTENVRQRSKKEVESTASFAIQKFAKDLLETVDVLAMAINATPKDQIEANKALKDLHDGVSMTRNVLVKALNRHGVEEFSPEGEQFDPNLHQALYQVPDPSKEAGTIMRVEKTGFKLNGRVLRPAQVGVIKDMSS